MSIRKRTWTSPKGETKEAWVVDYIDQTGRRRLKTFARKKEADAFRSTAAVEVRTGVHTADSVSPSVLQAAEGWLATCAAHDLEPSTLAAYRQHVDLHIAPYLGRTKLSQLTAPMVREFEDKLRRGEPAAIEQQQGRPRSSAMIRKVLVSLGSIIADAQERGLVARNVVRDLRSRRKRGKERQADRRQKGKLKVGVDIPLPSEVRAIIEKAEGRARPLILTVIFTGLRASELRGLRWADVDLKKAELHVRQRADRYNVIGMPKSEAGERTVPLPPTALNCLREWKLQCPKSHLDLVFPTRTGAVEHHSNMAKRALIPVQIAAGVTVRARDGKGLPLADVEGVQALAPKYPGLHAFRHFFASWCINRRKDGGLELPAKMVQERMGHSSIALTMDVYGHLFPRADDGDDLAAAERTLIG